MGTCCACVCACLHDEGLGFRVQASDNNLELVVCVCACTHSHTCTRAHTVDYKDQSMPEEIRLIRKLLRTDDEAARKVSFLFP
jgi:hypothetical protein